MASLGMRMECQVSTPLEYALRLLATGSPSPAATLTWVSIADDHLSTRSAFAGVLWDWRNVFRASLTVGIYLSFRVSFPSFAATGVADCGIGNTDAFCNRHIRFT